MSAGMGEIAGIRAGHAAQIRGEGKAMGEDYAFAAFDILCAALDARPGDVAAVAYFSNQFVQSALMGRTAPRAGDRVPVRPNPWFLANGKDDADSPVTQRYLMSRAWKSVAGTAVSAIGGAGQFAGSVINVGGTLQHGSAMATTLMHMQQIHAIARSHRNSVTIAQWCETIMRAKAAKAALRVVQIASVAIPVPLVGTIATCLGAAGKLGLKIGIQEMCYLAACEIHWRAFQEQQIAGSGASAGRAALKAGPASRIFREVFARRGITAAFGSYDVGALVREPAGWMALGDKLVRD